MTIRCLSLLEYMQDTYCDECNEKSSAMKNRLLSLFPAKHQLFLKHKAYLMWATDSRRWVQV